MPTPSKTELPRISTPRSGDTALSSAPIPYSVSPSRKQRLRPQRSVSLLHGIIRIAMIRRNNVIAVWTPLTVVSRSSLMSVIITFMFDPAKLQMNCASASGRISRRADASGRSGVSASLTDAEPSLTPRLSSRLGNRHRRYDQREVAERLREVADLPPPRHVVLLGEQAEIVGQADQPLEQRRAPHRPGRCSASALTSQNEQARNWPSSPDSPSSVSAVE